MSKLQALSDLLRDRSQWPDDFTWDYADSNHCAIGLAWETGLVRAATPSRVEPRHLGMPRAHMDHFNRIFWARHGTRWKVAPEVIADAIDDYLANGPAPGPVVVEDDAIDGPCDCGACRALTFLFGRSIDEVVAS